MKKCQNQKCTTPNEPTAFVLTSLDGQKEAVFCSAKCAAEFLEAREARK